MRWVPFTMPDGWPVSLWFFIVTAIVFLLQRFPLTGVFLMIVAAALWSVVLINLGMIGLILESVTGRVSPVWLLIPALYFGGYYWAYSNDQKSFAAVSREAANFNVGKSLAFSPVRQDLLFEDPKDGLGLRAADLIEKYGVPRVFDSHGRVWMVGTKESCELLRDKPVFVSAGIQSLAITRQGPSRWTRNSTGFCTISMPGKPDKPVVRITEKATRAKVEFLPITLRDLVALDQDSGKSATVRTGHAGPLKRFPMPMMGCALNSGAPAWKCFAGFMRDRVQVLPELPRYSSGMEILTAMLGLSETEDLAAHAIGPDRFKPMADRADAELVEKELKTLEAILADPLTPNQGWFSHLPNRPEVVAPYADRIFQALGVLQGADFRGRSNGRNLWRLVAILPEPALTPHRAQMAEWMKPGALREWTDDSTEAFTRLDVADAAQRDIVLSRFEKPGGDLPTSLLPPFCRMGAGAPQDAKDRLLGVWRARGEIARERGSDRGHNEVQLYLVLARMGLKEKAGKVEQRYRGPTFAAIWNEVTPETPAEICNLTDPELSNRFDRR